MAEAKKAKSTEKIDDIFSQLINEQNSVSPEAAVMGTDMFSIVKMWIPTGSMTLDTILSNGEIGGWPCGRVVELYGPESIGKCLTSDTYILTQKGYLTIEEIFKDNNLETHITNKEKRVQYPLVNRYSQIENTTHFLWSGRKDIKKVTTYSGSEIKGSHKHPLLVMSQSGNWVWKKLQEIVPGDYLVLNRNSSHFGSNQLSLRASYLLGILIADSCFSKNEISIDNNDPDVIEAIRTNGEELFGTSFLECPAIPLSFYITQSKKVQAFYKKYGLTSGVAKTKYFSTFIRSLNKHSLREVVKGFIDCEGWFDLAGGKIEVSSASEQLIKQLKLILQQFGIMSLLHPVHVNEYPNNKYWALNISGVSFYKYLREIGTNSKVREEEVKGWDRIKQVQTNVDSIPYINNIIRDLYDSTLDTSIVHNNVTYDCMQNHCNVTYERLRQILDLKWEDCYLFERLKELYESNYYYDKVISVEDVKKTPTFDFCTETTHSFIANGIVSHNSSLCFAGMAKAQQMGGIAIYHDVEQAGAITMMKANGIDMDRLVVSRLTSIEEIFAALEKNLNTIIKTPRFHAKPVFICIDSLAQMTTDSEIEAGYENNMNIALQKAKQIGKALRKIVPYLNQANAVLVFINQLRDDPGGNIYAGPLTPGGRALKFGASIRLEMRGRTAVKEMDVQIKAQYEADLEDWVNATEQWRTNGKLGAKPEKPKKPGGTGVEIILGYDVTLYTEKNKVAAPKRTAEFRLMFGQGIIEEIAWFDWAKKLKIIENVSVSKGLWRFVKHPELGEFKEVEWTNLLADCELHDEVNSTIQKALIRPMISTSTSTEDIKDLDDTIPNVIPD